MFDELAYKTLGTNDHAKMFYWFPKLIIGKLFLWPGSKNPVIYIVIMFSSIFINIGIILNYKEIFKNFGSIFASGIIFNGSLQVAQKCFVLWHGSEQWNRILEVSKFKFWSSELVGKTTKREIKAILNIITCITLSLLILGLIITLYGYGITPLFKKERYLPVLVKYPFDVLQSPVYELVYIHQIVYLELMITYIPAFDGLYLAFVASISCQYKILQQCLSLYNTKKMKGIALQLQNYFPEPSEHKTIEEEYLIKCFKHLLLLSRLVNQINKIYSGIVLIQFSFSIIGISITAVFLNMASLLPVSIFHSNWPDLKDEQSKKDLMFVLQYSQKIIDVKSYSIYEININMFLKVIKFTFSLYVGLLQLADK